jgi:hypothetical protein
MFDEYLPNILKLGNYGGELEIFLQIKYSKYQFTSMNL